MGPHTLGLAFCVIFHFSFPTTNFDTRETEAQSSQVTSKAAAPEGVGPRFRSWAQPVPTPPRGDHCG